MKNFKLLFAIVFVFGLFVLANNVQAQSIASDKEEAIDIVKAKVLGLAEVRFFENASGKEQYKIKGVYIGGTFEILINLNALGGKNEGCYNAIAKGVIYNWLGMPIWKGSVNEVIDNTKDVVVDLPYFLWIKMNWVRVEPI